MHEQNMRGLVVKAPKQKTMLFEQGVAESILDARIEYEGACRQSTKTKNNVVRTGCGGVPAVQAAAEERVIQSS